MDLTPMLNYFVSILPAKDLVYVIAALFTLSGLCNAIALFLTPPKTGTKLYTLRKLFYVIVTYGAANFAKAANRIQCGYTGVMVPYDHKGEATKLLETNGIPVKAKSSGKP